MDITGASYSNGTDIEWWTCNGGANQQWAAESNGTIVNPASGMCLDDPDWNVTNGTQLDLWACNGGTNQNWTVP
jgi:non-reducing end alpha-L-arabinofuranosidase